MEFIAARDRQHVGMLHCPGAKDRFLAAAVTAGGRSWTLHDPQFPSLTRTIYCCPNMACGDKFPCYHQVCPCCDTPLSPESTDHQAIPINNIVCVTFDPSLWIPKS